MTERREVILQLTMKRLMGRYRVQVSDGPPYKKVYYDYSST